MKRSKLGTFAFVLFIALIVTVGFQRGWFSVTTSEDAAANEVHVNLTLDRGKFQHDAEKAVDRTRQEATHLSNSMESEASRLNEPAHDRTAAVPAPTSSPDRL